MLFATRMGPDSLCGTILSAGAQFIITHAIPIGAEIVASDTFLSVGTSGTTILMVASFTITIVTIASYGTIPITISFYDTIPAVISPFDAVMVAVYNDSIPIATEIIIPDIVATPSRGLQCEFLTLPKKNCGIFHHSQVITSLAQDQIPPFQPTTSISFSIGFLTRRRFSPEE